MVTGAFVHFLIQFSHLCEGLLLVLILEENRAPGRKSLCRGKVSGGLGVLFRFEEMCGLILSCPCGHPGWSAGSH